MRIGVIGSRLLDDALLIDRCVQRLAARHGDALVIVSRGQRGTGRLVEAAARRFCKAPPEIVSVPWEEARTWMEEGREPTRAFVKSIDQLVVIFDAEDDGRGRDVLFAAKCTRGNRKPLFLYDVQKKAWITDAVEQWKICEEQFPSTQWWHHDRLHR